MNYFLIGYYGFGNSGDTASLFKVKKLILSIDTNADFKELHSSNINQQHLVYRWSFISIFKAIFWSDKIVFGGGSLLQNTTSSLSLYYYLSLILLCRMFGKPVIFLSQGIGPILGLFDQFLVTVFLKLVNKLSVRDQFSYSLFKLNVKQQIVLGSDITLFNEKKVFKPEVKDFSVGFALKPSHINDLFLRQIFIASQYVSTKQYCFAFFPKQDVGIYNMLGIAGSSVYQVTNLFNQANLPKPQIMVVMRYHAAIWAALNGIPFLAISTDPKLDSISKSLGQESYTIDNNEFNLNLFNTKLNHIFELFDDYQDKLVYNVEELIKLTENHKELFYETK